MVIDDGYVYKDESSLDMVVVSSITEYVIKFLKKNIELQNKNFVEYMCTNNLWHLFDDKYFMFGFEGNPHWLQGSFY